jgi:hypothetical protein
LCFVWRRQDEWVVCKVFNKKKEAETATKTAAAAATDGECSYSAVTTPNDSSVVDAGEDAGENVSDFLDSMFTIDPLYFPNSDDYTSNQQLPAKETTITTTNSNTNANPAAPPYNADYYYSVPTTTAATFNAMPNYSLTNAPSNMQAVALAADTMASSVSAIRRDSDVGSSWQHMLSTPPHGVMGRSYDANLRDQHQQAIMLRALEGVIGSTNFGAPAASLPSASGVPPQQKKLGSYDDGELLYGNYAAATMNGQPAAAAAKNFGAPLY